MLCDCITIVNEDLRQHNTKLSTAFSRVGTRLFVKPLISTEKINPRGKSGPMLVTPTYCPFCARKLADTVEAEQATITEGATHV
ncbi:MAG: hypothetical protein QM576_04305 [Rhodopseudomonas sp.]|uniref:hypothetical protein n=1 Tax=Rhodopseudomonas sp. TaxID=1078 RepID=UPI0039E335D7